MGGSCGNEPRLAGEQLLHHGLLEVAGLVAAGFERRQLGVHVGEDGGDGGLFVMIGQRDLEGSYVATVDAEIIGACQPALRSGGSPGVRAGGRRRSPDE